MSDTFLKLADMKKVIIVGATSGIGRELARIYAGNGALVGVTGRRQHLLDSLQAEFPAHIRTAHFDVMGTENISSLEKLVAALEGLDLLIVSAGIGTISKTLDWEIDKTTIDTNVSGFTEMVNWAYNYFQQHGGGQIANISSIAAWRGNSWAPAYSASKAYQSVYFEGLHMKSRKTNAGIVITDIQPGFVDTKMAQGNGRFWVASVSKASRQIYQSIEAKKFRAYVTRRWRLIVWVMKWVPGFIFHKVG